MHRLKVMNWNQCKQIFDQNQEIIRLRTELQTVTNKMKQQEKGWGKLSEKIINFKPVLFGDLSVSELQKKQKKNKQKNAL